MLNFEDLERGSELEELTTESKDSELKMQDLQKELSEIQEARSGMDEKLAKTLEKKEHEAKENVENEEKKQKELLKKINKFQKEVEELEKQNFDDYRKVVLLSKTPSELGEAKQVIALRTYAIQNAKEKIEEMKESLEK
ncbi:MAG: hypothetical protein ACI4E3_03245 [Candidatus Fimousia sp.]